MSSYAKKSDLYTNMNRMKSLPKLRLKLQASYSDLSVKWKAFLLICLVTAGALLLFSLLITCGYLFVGRAGAEGSFGSFLVVLVLCFIVSLGSAVMASRYLLRPIIRPLAMLADSVRIITEVGDYSIRVKLSSKDEVGKLASDFNSMLETLQLRDDLLDEFHENLAELVERRTEEVLAERRRAELAEALKDSENSGKQSKTPLSSLVEMHMSEIASNAKQTDSDDLDNQASLAEQLGGKVLLVDDEQIGRQLLKGILHQIGLKTTEAENGAQAVRMVELEYFPLVLIDIQMPGMNGYQATNMIRAMEKNSARKPAKVIGITASDNEESRAKCLEVGMDECLLKPVGTDLLRQTIARLMEANYERAEVADTVETADGTKQSASKSSEKEVTHKEVEDLGAVEVDTVQELLWNKDRALELVGGDEELFCELATVFIVRNELLVQNIVRSIECGDADDLQETAHAYKGAVAHFAAPGLRKLALALERHASQGTVTGIDRHLAQLQENSERLCQELQLFVSQVAAQGNELLEP